MGWFVACTLIGLGFYVTFRIVLGAPTWVQVLIGLLVVAALGSTVAMARAFVTFSDEGITQRSLKTRRYHWPDLEAWTQWGAKGSTFVRTKSGCVFGFNEWCVYGSRNQKVYAILSDRLGPEATGRHAVLPPALARALASVGIERDDK
jgi:hypothetical protein